VAITVQIFAKTFLFQANFTQAMVDRLTIMGSAIIGNNVTVAEVSIAAVTLHIVT
jgi:hypothetical protein